MKQTFELNEQVFVFKLGQIVIFVFTAETSAEKIEDLLQFWTAYPDLPSMNEKLKVGFLPMQSDKVLAVADACFDSLNIPTCHADFSQFMKYMDISVSHGKHNFGSM